MKLKTFEDLEFGPHPADKQTGKLARMFFENGFGISVVRFMIGNSYGSYTNDKTWEVAVLKKEKKGWDLCYTTPIADNVIGHLTDEEVTEVMIKIQKL